MVNRTLINRVGVCLLQVFRDWCTIPPRLGRSYIRVGAGLFLLGVFSDWCSIPPQLSLDRRATHLKGAEEPSNVFPARGFHDGFLVLV